MAEKGNMDFWKEYETPPTEEEMHLDACMVVVMNNLGHMLEKIIEKHDSQRFNELQMGCAELFKLAAGKHNKAQGVFDGLQ